MNLRAELKRRIKRLRANLENETILITDPSSLFYLSGRWFFSAIGILNKEEFVILSRTRELENPLDVGSLKEFSWKYLKSLISGNKILCDTFDLQRIALLKRRLKRKVYPSSIVLKARAIKTQFEIERIKHSVNIARKSFQLARRLISEKKRENEIAGELERFLRLKGAERFFDEGVIVSSAKNSGNIHAVPKNKKVSGLVLVDIGARINGYFSDLTRTFIASKIPKYQENLVEEIKGIKDELADKISECSKFSEIENFGKRKIERLGYKKYHAFMHGIGIDVHEYLPENIEDGITFTIEPGIYTKNFGVRFEDVYVIKKGKAKIL